MNRLTISFGLVITAILAVALVLTLQNRDGEQAAAAQTCSVWGIAFGGGGKVSGGARVTCGETVTLTATAKEGYCFSHWSGDAPSEGCPPSSQRDFVTTEGTFITGVYFKPEPTPTPTPEPATTALSYNLLTTKPITEPGSYSFLEDVNDTSSAIDWMPKGGTYGLLLHAADADGTLQEDLYDGVGVGDRFDLEGKADGCFLRIHVRKVLPDLASVHPIKVLEVEIVSFMLSYCGPDHPFNTATSPVTFRWHVAPGVAGDDGIRVMLGHEPTPGPGRYRLLFTDVVLTIPAGTTITIVGGGIPYGGYSGLVMMLEDSESGSLLTIGDDGTEVGRRVEHTVSSGARAAPLSSGSKRDVGAVFDQIVASIELVPRSRG